MSARKRPPVRSFEELGPEFAEGVDLPPDDASRREFIKLLGASLAMAGMAGCTRAPREKIVPYTTQPPEVTPGIPNHYATTMTVDGYGIGLIVESHEGRPTKIEGNPHHPASLGATSAIEQAAVLELYDPSRARALHQRGQQRGWRAFFDTFGAETSQRAYAGRGQGEGLHVLAEPTTSPLAIDMIERLRRRYPRVQVHFHSAIARNEAWEGSRLVCGRVLEAHHDLRKASVVVALDADFLSTGPFAVRDARHAGERRTVRAATDEMSRLYVVESALSVTGGYADHRLRLRRSDVRAVTAGLLAEVLRARGKGGEGGAIVASLERLRHRGPHEKWIAAVARDLVAHAGESVVLTSNAQPREVHAMVHMLNAALGNLGKTTWFTDSAVYEAGAPSHDLAPLLDALDRKEVDTLLVLDGNPCYTTAGDLELPRRMRLARERIYLGLYENETAAEATWFVPAAHWLEQWGVTRAYDGTTSIVQPLLEPLHGGRTPAEVLAAFTGERTPDAHSLVRELFRAAGSFPDFETAWETALQRGTVEGTALPIVDVTPDAAALASVLDALQPPADGLELGFALDPKVRDGRFTNNAWLLELPDPITKLTWENALALSPKTAARLGVEQEDVVELTLRGRSVTAPIVVVPGHAEESATLTFGYGRTGAEVLARGLGVDAFALQSSAAPRFDLGLGVRKVGRRQKLARTQEHWSMEGRDIVRHATLAEYRKEPRFARAEDDEKPKTPLYKLPLAPDSPSPAAALGNHKDQWAMSIDLNLCNGCSACVVACQAENNTPIVGKQGVIQSREMHWLRIDRYFEDEDGDDPQMVVQPMLCQHCEKAPCEYVCPVNATVHSPDGINEQVYNRCVGTRFCSNNCPYKVRRFNWFDYHEDANRGGTPQVRELRKMVLNPDVTVRARGVMEKCSFCVQRVRENEIKHRIDGAPSKEGDLQTACQQACPTTAIVFGSLTWKDAEVSRRRENERAYGVLSELGTEPRVQYLARLRNVNPELDES